MVTGYRPDLPTLTLTFLVTGYRPDLPTLTLTFLVTGYRPDLPTLTLTFLAPGTPRTPWRQKRILFLIKSNAF